MSAPILRVEQLAKRYRSRSGDKLAVDSVSFAVARHEVVGLLGPNGAGKTTTIKCLCSLIRPDGGSVHINGVDLARRPLRALEHVAAVLEGNRNLYWRLTSRENLELFAGLQGSFAREVRARIEKLLERFDLARESRTPAQMLSRGMQQRLALACALVRGAELLLLDEPTLGLDVVAAHDLRVMLRDLAAGGERTLLLSSHDMDLVQAVCDRVIILHEGRVVTDDAVANLLQLFKARAYEIALAAPLSPAQERDLERRFELLRIERDRENCRIAVELLGDRDFYDLVEVLRRENTPIESIDRRDPNLEEIYLQLLHGGAQR